MFLWLNHPNREHDSTYNFVERTYNVISGEHMARDASGMEGALESGERAALQALAGLG